CWKSEMPKAKDCSPARSGWRMTWKTTPVWRFHSRQSGTGASSGRRPNSWEYQSIAVSWSSTYRVMKMVRMFMLRSLRSRDSSAQSIPRQWFRDKGRERRSGSDEAADRHTGCLEGRPDRARHLDGARGVAVDADALRTQHHVRAVLGDDHTLLHETEHVLDDLLAVVQD